jgi:hypothetical protein
MGINLDAIKNKLSSLQQNTSTKNNIWKPEPGTQVIRIVPYQHNKDNPFTELYFHYGFGKTILSPISFGKEDPIVDFAEKLKSSGSSDDWKLGKKLDPTMRCYVPILVRGKESEGIKFWGFGKTVYQELLSFITDPDYGDITDPVAGRDITVDFKTKEQAGKDFPETSIRIKPNQTKITDQPAVLEKLKNQPKVTDNWKEYTSEELSEILMKWMDPESEETTETNGSVESTKSADPIGSSAEDVASAFDSLFNK